MLYKSQSLTFESDKIIVSSSIFDMAEVMMDWEYPLMSASAAYVTKNGGDILEIGFGMGISAGYIQSHSINSHTIVEIHPDVIPKVIEWAVNKNNVSIITGSWYYAFGSKYCSKNGIKWEEYTKPFDGVFYDTFGDTDYTQFSSSLKSLVKEGGVATWWNSMTGSNNFYDIPNVEYDIIDIDPPQNTYFNHNRYFLPKKQF